MKSEDAIKMQIKVYKEARRKTNSDLNRAILDFAIKRLEWVIDEEDK